MSDDQQRVMGVHQNTPFWGNVCGGSEPGGARAAFQQVWATASSPIRIYSTGGTASRVDAEPLRCREVGSAGSEQQPHTAGLR